MVRSAVRYCFELCSYSHFVWGLFRFLSLRDLWSNQLYFFQRVSNDYNSFRYNLGIITWGFGIIVWLLNFFAYFLPNLAVYLFVPLNCFSRSNMSLSEIFLKRFSISLNSSPFSNLEKIEEKFFLKKSH